MTFDLNKDNYIIIAVLNTTDPKLLSWNYTMHIAPSTCSASGDAY